MNLNKTIITTFSALFLCFSLKAQEPLNTESEHKNEFGLDVTGFVRYFTKFQNSSDYFYDPVYYLTYRRLFEPGNIRFGIGGDLTNLETPGMVGDSSTYRTIENSLSTRLGWEFKTELSKRWQAYYGADFRFTISHNKEEAAFFNGGYANGYDTKATVYGVAPVLGFRFKINDRISLLTEASFSLNFMKYETKNTYIPLSGFPDKMDEVAPTTNSFFTSFSQPLALFFVFNI